MENVELGTLGKRLASLEVDALGLEYSERIDDINAALGDELRRLVDRLPGEEEDVNDKEEREGEGFR